MKKTFLILFIFPIFIINLLALDDITTGNELNYNEEFLTLFLSIPALLIFGHLLMYGKRKTHNKK